VGVTYTTEVIGNGNHASIEIPHEILMKLDAGYREVDIPLELAHALDSRGLRQPFDGLTYSKRKEHVRKVTKTR
jgi:hypothetical protein